MTLSVDIPPAYKGREQAFVKHTILSTYLESLAFKVLRSFPHFVFVDGFSGPWKTKTEDLNDTSFGKAVEILHKVKNSFHQTGLHKKITIVLVEKSPKSFKKLQVIAVKTKGIQIIPIKGKFEDNIDQILDYIPTDAFCLTFVDPKGWTQYPFSKVGSIIERKPGEVLINFMYDFINRATNIEDPKIRERLDLLFASTHWKKRITTDLSKTERETAIVNEFMETLKRVGNYPFALSTPVKQRGKNRTLYHLVYGTAHERGIEVFRDSERTALKKEFVTQATIKHEIAEAKSKTRDLFSVDDLPLEEDLMRFIRDQKEQAKQYVLKILHKNRSVNFETIWIQVLQRIPLRLTELKDVLVEMSKEGLVLLEFDVL